MASRIVLSSERQRTLMQRYEPTPEAAMAAFAKSRRRE
jgi:hypothetical protein